MTGKNVLLVIVKVWLEKAATIVKFEYSPLGSELKKKIDIVGKQYQGLYQVYEFNKKEGDETIKMKKLMKK